MLIPSDYSLQVRGEIKNLLSRGDAFILEKAEKASGELIKSYLKKKYDTALIFSPLTEFEIMKRYYPGDFVFWKGDLDNADAYRIYECTFECQGIDPIEEDFWKKGDPRNSLLVMYYIDIVLYHLYSSVPSSKIPEHRIDRYTDALEWLKEISKDNIEVDLPYKTESKQNYNFRFKSETKRTHRY